MVKTAFVATIFALTLSAEPPAVLRVIRNGDIQAYVDTKTAVNVIGMSAVSGLAETWLMEFHDSFGSVEETDGRLSSWSSPRQASGPPSSADDILPQSKSIIAIYRADLSYRPDQAIQSLAKMRYFDLVLYRIRTGTEGDFGKFLRLRNSSMDSVNLDRPTMVYQGISGSRSGTYLVLTPLPSLRVFDEARPSSAFAEGDLSAARKIVSDIDLVRERFWFRIDPRLSVVSDEFADGDADFWHGR